MSWQNTPCKEWTGRIGSRGYGVTAALIGKTGTFEAHRVAWWLAHGPIPKGMLVCHHCDNKKCWNVEHLFLGTPSDNAKDYWNKKRSRAPDVRAGSTS